MEKQARRLAWENFLSRLDQNNRTPQSIATVHEFVERKFLPEHVALLKKAGSIHYGKRHEKTGEYTGMLAHILPALGQKRLREVRYEDVQRLGDFAGGCHGVPGRFECVPPNAHFPAGPVLPPVYVIRFPSR
jgi:hypothetical protein